MSSHFIIKECTVQGLQFYIFWRMHVINMFNIDCTPCENSCNNQWTTPDVCSLIRLYLGLPDSSLQNWKHLLCVSLTQKLTNRREIINSVISVKMHISLVVMRRWGGGDVDKWPWIGIITVSSTAVILTSIYLVSRCVEVNRREETSIPCIYYPQQHFCNLMQDLFFHSIQHSGVARSN